MAGWKKRKNDWTTIGVLLPASLLFTINLYTFTKLGEIAEKWSLSLIPGSLSAQITQLALILALNNFVIIWLLLCLFLKKR